MMLEHHTIALFLIFLADLAGAIGKAVYPFMQQKKQNEDELRMLSLIPDDKLTEEQRQFIKTASTPLNFRKYYAWTALFGFVGTVTISITGFSSLLATLPQNLSLSTVSALLPVAFLTGWGGGSVSNQLLSSKKAVISSITNSMHASIIGKLIPPLPGKKQEEDGDVEVVDEDEVYSTPSIKH